MDEHSVKIAGDVVTGILDTNYVTILQRDPAANARDLTALMFCMALLPEKMEDMDQKLLDSINTMFANIEERIVGEINAQKAQETGPGDQRERPGQGDGSAPAGVVKDT